MNVEHTKSAKSPISGCSVVQQVHLLSLLRVLELKESCSLSTLVPRPLSTVVPKHLASVSVKSRDVIGTWDLPLFLEPTLASNLNLTGGVSGTQAPCLFRHGQLGATLMKKGDLVAGIHTKNLVVYYPRWSHAQTCVLKGPEPKGMSYRATGEGGSS